MKPEKERVIKPCYVCGNAFEGLKYYGPYEMCPTCYKGLMQAMGREEKMISFDDFCREQPCYWNKDQKCTGGSYCDACEHQPADEDKPNGKKDPVKINWQNDYGMKMPYCPACGEMAYGTERCKFCGQPFIQEDAPQNRTEIIGGTETEDGIIVCSKCGNDSMKLAAHADGADFFDYTYRCMKCESSITVRTFLNDFV